MPLCNVAVHISVAPPGNRHRITTLLWVCVVKHAPENTGTRAPQRRNAATPQRRNAATPSTKHQQAPSTKHQAPSIKHRPVKGYSGMGMGMSMGRGRGAGSKVCGPKVSYRQGDGVGRTRCRIGGAGACRATSRAGKRQGRLGDTQQTGANAEEQRQARTASEAGGARLAVGHHACTTSCIPRATGARVRVGVNTPAPPWLIHVSSVSTTRTPYSLGSNHSMTTLSPHAHYSKCLHGRAQARRESRHYNRTRAKRCPCRGGRGVPRAVVAGRAEVA